MDSPVPTVLNHTPEYTAALSVALQKFGPVKEAFDQVLNKILLEIDDLPQEIFADRKLREAAKILQSIVIAFRDMSVRKLVDGEDESSFSFRKNQIILLRRSCRDPHITLLIRKLLVILGSFTRKFRLFFGVHHLSTLMLTCKGSHGARLSKGNSWPSLDTSCVSSPKEDDFQLDNYTTPKALRSKGRLPSPVSAQAVVPRPKSNKKKPYSVPPPLDTCHVDPVFSPSSMATPRNCNPGTPLSCLSARCLSVLELKPRSSPNSSILCRICEVMIPSNRIELHTEVCGERLTNMMVLDHVMAQLKRSTLRHQTSKSVQRDKIDLLMAVFEKCKQVASERQPHLAWGVVKQLHTLCRSNESHSSSDIDVEFNKLLESAMDACNSAAEILQVAVNVMTPNELVDVGKLRGSTAVTITDFKIKGVIARGTFGRVFLVEKRKSRDTYALKVLSKSDVITRKMTQKLLNERNVMAFTQSSQIVKLHYSFASTKYLYLAMEYMPGGDLFSLLERVESFDESTARFYIAEVYLALEYLHSMSVVHRDLKPDNILLSETGHIKLTDFGLSDVGVGFVLDNIISKTDNAFQSCYGTPKNQSQRADEGGGTPDYVAPEIILGDQSDKMADYWSLGVLLYEFITGCPPFAADTAQQTFDNILRVSYEPSGGSDSVTDLIENLLQFQPESRIQRIKEHPFFESIDWHNILHSQAPYKPDLTKNNFEERAAIYSINSTDGNFLQEELQPSGDDESTFPQASPANKLNEFLKRPQQDDNLSLYSFHLATKHVADLAKREAAMKRGLIET
eukprot:TRINITY_DN14510_c2_g1_i2.p1 TRINITY_DN14510_c2_g1~~TRINITY_DN14510_c2_g1_i2.p1  ORF type:complete len:838 (+),score=82.77 TRINITY_DN14510_c2_g1_i2:133-2514(+)